MRYVFVFMLISFLKSVVRNLLSIVVSLCNPDTPLNLRVDGLALGVQRLEVVHDDEAGVVQLALG